MNVTKLLAKATRDPAACRFTEIQRLVEALREAQLAKQAWLEAARSAGKPIPRPRYRPVIDSIAS